MDHLIGQRFNLISKSEIRYLGTLHEINPDESTIALENVYSFGTEDRTRDNFIPPSADKFAYILFRGSDVKDIKIVEEQENQQPTPPPPHIPNDPAILNTSRPGQSQAPPQPQDPRGQSPFPPPGYPPHPQFGAFPPPQQQYGRGFGPPGGFGPGPQLYPQPPPGYFNGPPPPGQGFPQGPSPFPQHPAPIGPPGQRRVPHPPPPQPPSQPPSKQTSELPDNKAPVPPPDDPKQTPSSFAAAAAKVPAAVSKAAPSTQPVVSSKKVTPAVPFTVNQKSFTPPVSQDGPLTSSVNGKPQPPPASQSLEDASRLAKAAVAEAMAKLNPQTASLKAPAGSGAIDALTRQVSELATHSGQGRGRGGHRGGRARGAPAAARGKIDIPKSDYDFESANAKFNKEDLIKEAIATGSPVAEDGTGPEAPALERNDSGSLPAPAYNKSTSFFDNISSEAKEREAGGDAYGHGRGQRGVEYKKNLETFGQGNVDNYRGGYRGRGRGFRGRGHRGRGRGANPATTAS